MCLTVRKIDEKKKNKPIVAWKILVWDHEDQCWATPYRWEKVKNKVLKAKKPIKKNIPTDIEGGAIHCYSTRKRARLFCCEYTCVFKVIGTGYIADGHYGDIAFRKIEFVDNPSDYEFRYKKEDR